MKKTNKHCRGRRSCLWSWSVSFRGRPRFVFLPHTVLGGVRASLFELLCQIQPIDCWPRAGAFGHHTQNLHHQAAHLDQHLCPHPNAPHIQPAKNILGHLQNEMMQKILLAWLTIPATQSGKSFLCPADNGPKIVHIKLKLVNKCPHFFWWIHYPPVQAIRLNLSSRNNLTITPSRRKPSFCCQDDKGAGVRRQKQAAFRQKQWLSTICQDKWQKLWQVHHCVCCASYNPFHSWIFEAIRILETQILRQICNKSWPKITPPKASLEQLQIVAKPNGTWNCLGLPHTFPSVEYKPVRQNVSFKKSPLLLGRKTSQLCAATKGDTWTTKRTGSATKFLTSHGGTQPEVILNFNISIPQQFCKRITKFSQIQHEGCFPFVLP